MLMPKVDLRILWQKLPPADMAIVRRIVREKTWRLRTTRPTLRESDESRYAAYVWRMVAFQISPNSKHHCMKTPCFWWLPQGITKVTMQHLNRLVDEITNTIDESEWWGVRAWSGLSSDQAELRQECLKGFNHDVKEYLEDSANRKAHFDNQGSHESRRELRDSGRASEVEITF